MFKIRRFIMIMAGAAAMGVAIFLTSSMLGLAASNSVPTKHLALVTRAKLIADYTPAGCAAMTLTNIIYCTTTSTCNGTSQADLMLGNSQNNIIRGAGGNDCIVAGGGNDTVNGQTGSNRCIEGPGTDSYSNCTVVTP